MIGTVRIPMVCALLLLPGVLLPSERFDGKWLATVTCPAKGKTLGYKVEVPSAIKDGNFRGERGAAGEPGYLLIEGKIADNGSAKLAATGKVSSREYGTGVFTTQGSDYSYNIKAQFQETHGSGERDKGLGVVGRACPVDFVKQ
jgi:hypothetical protein